MRLTKQDLGRRSSRVRQNNSLFWNEVYIYLFWLLGSVAYFTYILCLLVFKCAECALPIWSQCWCLIQKKSTEHGTYKLKKNGDTSANRFIGKLNSYFLWCYWYFTFSAWKEQRNKCLCFVLLETDNSNIQIIFESETAKLERLMCTTVNLFLCNLLKNT